MANSSFPSQAVQDLIDFLRRKGTVSTLQLLKDLHDLYGWVLEVSQQMGSVTPAAQDQIGEEADDDEFAGHLEELLAQHKGVPKAGFTVPAWLLPLIAELLQRVLTQTG